MNESVWHNIFMDWIDCYMSIKCLEKNNVVEDEEESRVLYMNLLSDMIETMKGEVEAC